MARNVKKIDKKQHFKPKVLDLFSGAGGISWGFHSAGFKIIGGLDYFGASIESFEKNMPEAVGMVRDLRKPGFDDVRDVIGTEDIDVIVGGPSCQGFSTSGGLSRTSGRDESDPRNRLFINYLDMVDEFRPSWIVFENVPGLLLYNQGRVAIDIVRAFKEIGYSVAPMILLAADFGVPQLRRRLFFVGNRTGADNCFPAATHGNPELWKNYSLPFAHLSRIGHGANREVAPHVSFADACSDLPPIEEGEELNGAQYLCDPTTPYQALMRTHSQTVEQHAAADLPSLDRLAATVLLEGQNWRNMPANSLPARFSRIRPYDATTLLKRLSSGLPSYTITTKFNEATTGAFIHPTQARTISLREAARLQSFPDHFLFSGTASQIRQQIGNAVPPILAQAIAEAIYPSVVRDVFKENVESTRDSVVVENSLTESDILKLKAPRRVREQEEITYDQV
ncbi:DNA cytosine methyltransferase [Rhizobium glycinendophyticum]|nr:DNA cytosine methyltransferase [Rhizobium glycinendophyticum]